MAPRTHYPAPVCPKCGKRDNRVKNTYYTEDDRILRTKICNCCDWRWWTIQYPEQNLNPAKFSIHIPRFGTVKGARKQCEIRSL